MSKTQTQSRTETEAETEAKMTDAEAHVEAFKDAAHVGLRRAVEDGTVRIWSHDYTQKVYMATEEHTTVSLIDGYEIVWFTPDEYNEGRIVACFVPTEA